jgi:hypothetical protein
MGLKLRGVFALQNLRRSTQMWHIITKLCTIEASRMCCRHYNNLHHQLSENNMVAIPLPIVAGDILEAENVA